MYSMAPTSRPRVGCTATRRSGSLSISRAMIAFCWFPPDMLRVMDVSDRILVMYEGELVGQLDPKTVSVEELCLYMAGAKRDPVPEEV